MQRGPKSSQTLQKPLYIGYSAWLVIWPPLKSNGVPFRPHHSFSVSSEPESNGKFVNSKMQFHFRVVCSSLWFFWFCFTHYLCSAFPVFIPIIVRSVLSLCWLFTLYFSFLFSLPLNVFLQTKSNENIS